MKFTSLQTILLITTLLVSAIASPAVALEFDETHIFPFFRDIIFSETAIGFPAHRHYGVFDDFLLDRSSGSFRAIDSEAFQQAFSDRRAPAGDLPSKHGFTTNEAYCAEGRVGHHDKLMRNGEVIPVPISLCSSISTLRVIDDQVWLGTLAKSEGAEYSAEGVVVLSLEDGRHLKTVRLPGAVSTLRVDPYAGHIWVSTQAGIFEIDRQMNRVAGYYFYHDFDPGTGEPRLLVASRSKRTNPLAVVVRGLPLDDVDQKALYEAIQSIPKEVIDRFSLGAYFMSLSPFPKEMNVLVPFFIKTTNSVPANMKHGRYITLCRFDDPRVGAFLLEESHHYYSKQASAALARCLNKYGLSKESEQAAIRLEELKEQKRKREADQKFASLTANYFIEFRREVFETHYRTMKDLCVLIVWNPDYVGRLVALFIERGVEIPRDSNFFAHCIDRYIDRKGFDQFLPFLIEGLNTKQAGLVLQTSCNSLRAFPQERLAEAVVPVLRARTTATLNRTRYDSYAINLHMNCVKASQWVLGQREKVDMLLEELEDHPEIHSAAFDTLHEITGVDLRSVDEWKNWWAERRELWLQ